MATPRVDPLSISDDRRGRGQRFVIGLVVAAVVIALGAVAFASVAGSSGTRYRTAIAGLRDVRSTIDGVASIEPVSQATVAFPVAGTVATVSVAAGDRVQAGQSVAALDPESLTQTLHQKEAALANARLTLQKAIDAQDAAATSTTAVTPTTTPGGSLQQQIAAAQRSVVQSQQAVDRAMTKASTAVTAAQTPCASPSTPPEIAQCQTALQSVTSAQAEVQTAQQQLNAAMAHLDDLLNQQASSGGSSGTTPTTSGGSSRPATSSVPTAATIAANQAAVDSAQAAVTVAQQNLQMATLVSPIDGRVVAVNLAPGQTVTANSTTQTIVVQGPGGFEATMTVSVDLIPRVRVGQDATVLPDGADAPVAAHVSRVALAPTTSATAATAVYRVTLAITGGSDELQNGSIATASILTESAAGVLAVPTSAVHADISGGRAVTVLDGSTTTEATVTVGIVGSEYTQITQGLREGSVVVLADLQEALPGTATKTSTSSTVATNGPVGGNFPGGGNFPSGGFQPPNGGQGTPPN